MVKVVEVADSSRQKTLRGHDAPVLSVTFDPKDDFLVREPSAMPSLSLKRNGFHQTVDRGTLIIHL